MCTVMAHNTTLRAHNHFVDTQNRNTQPLCKNNTHNHSEDSFKVYHLSKGKAFSAPHVNNRLPYIEQDIITVYSHNTPE